MRNGDGLYEYDYSTRKYTFPDQLDFNNEPFATVIPARSVTFKVHKTEGLANSALSNFGSGAKYRQISGVWVKVWEFYEPENCENCTKPLTDNDKSTDYYGNAKVWLRSPLHRGSHIFAPYLCRDCYEAESKIYNERQQARHQAYQRRLNK